MPALIRLVHAHAEYERGTPPQGDLSGRLDEMLFAPEPRLYAFVAEIQGEIVGYASCSVEASTWGGEYLHMDCLFLQPAARGAGTGRQLVDALVDFGSRLGLAQMQWQTPDWNADAIRFYDRLSSTRTTKQRYVLSLTTTT